AIAPIDGYGIRGFAAGYPKRPPHLVTHIVALVDEFGIKLQRTGSGRCFSRRGGGRSAVLSRRRLRRVVIYGYRRRNRSFIISDVKNVGGQRISPREKADR